jgi:hypothetical protein
MARQKGNTLVRHGFYWNLQKWEMTMIPRHGGVLPGTAAEGYFRIPTPMFLVLAPLMGLLYVVFLPVIGFALVLGHLGKVAGEGIKALFMKVVVTVSPDWQPGEAYLAARRKARQQRRQRAAGRAPDRALVELADEIERKRRS